jgi:putative oxidoreductase
MATHADKAALINRVALGCMFIAHALLKSVVYTLSDSAQYFASLGIPGWLAYVVTFGEFFGGAAMVLGIRTRWAAMALLPVLLGTLWVHSGNGWLFTSPNGGWEYSAMLIVVSIVQILLGDGAFALAPEKRSA